jgi:hypothetical protein
MNLMQLVVSIVEEDGSGTADTVLAQCPPGCTRRQVIAALQNARSTGLLTTAGYAGVPGGDGAKLAVYVPAPELPDTPPPYEPRFPRVASVFDLGAAA